MKKFVLFLTLFAFIANVLGYAGVRTDYFKEGTRWIELRLDTTKYNSWFCKNPDGTYQPNYEETEFYVHVDTQRLGFTRVYEYVWQHVDGQPDSLRFAVDEEYSVKVGPATLLERNGEMLPYAMGTETVYSFDFSVGTKPCSFCMSEAGLTIINVYKRLLSEIKEVKEGCFGTDKVLTYADVDSVYSYKYRDLYRQDAIDAKLIDGIGVNRWMSRYCIFGPSWPANVTDFMSDPYMSILVHFERDGEVLYDQWPTPDGGMAQHVQDVLTSGSQDDSAVYDLQGRKVEGKPSRGIYIIGGKKRVVE